MVDIAQDLFDALARDDSGVGLERELRHLADTHLPADEIPQAIQALTRKHGVNLAGVRYILALLKTLQLSGLEPPDGLKDMDVSLLDV